MRLMFVLLCLISLRAEAVNINRGDLEVQGGFNLSNIETTSYYYGDSERRTTFALNGGAQYFLKDKLSAGLDFSLVKTGGPRSLSWSMGPAATYYFLTQEKIAPYVYVSPFRIMKTESKSARFSSTLRGGTKFFFTDSVAFGPALEFEHLWEKGTRKAQENLKLLGMFSIHL